MTDDDASVDSDGRHTPAAARAAAARGPAGPLKNLIFPVYFAILPGNGPGNRPPARERERGGRDIGTMRCKAEPLSCSAFVQRPRSPEKPCSDGEITPRPVVYPQDRAA